MHYSLQVIYLQIFIYTSVCDEKTLGLKILTTMRAK